MGLDEYETGTSAGWLYPRYPVPAGGGLPVESAPCFGGEYVPDTMPQVYRVVREMLPRERFAPYDLLRWIEDAQRRYGQARRPHAHRRASPNTPPCTVVELLV